MNRYDDFFLGYNVNEPVAIEIPVRVKNPHELGDFLTKLGFDITYDGTEKGKILIDTTADENADNVSTYSVITPALNPQERIQFYSVLKDAIEEFIKICKERGDKFGKSSWMHDKDPNMFYPHLLDLKYLITDSSNVGADREHEREIDKILDELEKSGEAKSFYYPSENERLKMYSFERDKIDNNNESNMEELFPKGYIYNGSTIPDPYSVSTTWGTRFMRYGTKHPVYALNYTGVTRVKDLNGYQNLCPRGTRSIGFVYQYRFRNDDQIFFDNAGIELQMPPELYSRTIGENDETVVTRFDNPCVGVYLMWGSVRDTRRFYVYRIDENDPRYQILKRYYKPANPNLHDNKRARFETWNREGENHETYMPVKDGNLEQTQANVNALIQKRQAEAERLVTLQKDIDSIDNQIESIKIDLWIRGPNRNDIFSILEFEKTIATKEQEVQNVILQVKQIEKNLEALKNEVLGNEKLKAKYMTQIEKKESSLQDKMKMCNEGLQKLNSYKEDNKHDIQNLIKDYVRPSMNIYYDSFEKLPLDLRKQILNLLLEKVQYFVSERDIQVMASRLVRLYVKAPEQDKPELFDLLYQIRQKMPNDFRKVVKKVASDIAKTEDDKYILTELFDRDWWFKKHTENAIKKMKIIIATNNVKQQMGDGSNGMSAPEHER